MYLIYLSRPQVGVNILAQYVLRYRHYYSEALYDRTADFDNISFLESQSDNHLRQAGLEKDLPDDLHASFKPPHGCACQRS
ncbi:unnamed protein product [Durusdinium trenchii]|uniref:Uncharacterized protein n=1 Tax=Durusdinium trenchii TaxID=1381693 RepID=A0ABP0R391_9DINO